MDLQGEESQIEWIGYSCPSCRVLFRVSSASRGRRVECPGCGELAWVPPSGSKPTEGTEAFLKTDEEAPAAGRERTAGPDLSFPGPSKGDGPPRRRKVIKAAGEVEDLDWDSEGSSVRTRGQKALDSPVLILVGGLAVLILIAGVIAFMVLKQNRLEQERRAQHFAKVIKGRADTESSEPEVMQKDPMLELPRLEERAREFLAAENVDELLALSRGGAELQGVIRDYYSRYPLEPVIPREIAPSGTVQKSEGMWALPIRLPDFSLKPMALEWVKDQYLVDWASWVGYSEVPWERMMEVRPAGPVLLRVICAPVPYYNYGFSDDRKWQAYSLHSPDRRHTLYGYVERYSIAAGRLPKTVKKTSEGRDRFGDAFLLRVRCTEHSGPDQVLIEEVVSPGWVMRELDKSAPVER